MKIFQKVFEPIRRQVFPREDFLSSIFVSSMTLIIRSLNVGIRVVQRIQPNSNKYALSIRTGCRMELLLIGPASTDFISVQNSSLTTF